LWYDCARVDEVRPHHLPLYEIRDLLDAGLAESKEPPLVNLATHLQKAPQATTWTDLKDMVSRFDTTAAGRLRLILSTVSEIEDNSNRKSNNRKRSHDNSSGSECEWCHGFHLSDKCWQKYPHKKPELPKKKDDRNKGGGEPKFTFGAAKDKLTMIMMWSTETDLGGEIQLLMDDGRPFILVDSGASNVLFLLTDRNILEDFQVCERELGTARVTGILKVKGTGKIGHQSVDWCPDLRRSIISCGRLQSWTCDFIMRANAVLEICTSQGHKQTQSMARVGNKNHTTRSTNLQMTPRELDLQQPSVSNDVPQPTSTSPTVRTAHWIKQQKSKKHRPSSPNTSPYQDPNITSKYADTVPALNRYMDSLASTFDWVTWAEKNNCYYIGNNQVNNVETNERTAGSTSDSSDKDTDLPQGSLKDLRRATMLRVPHGRRKKFLAAENKELKAIEDLNVIEGMVPIPRGVKTINTRFVYAVKDPVS
jgi:hypothetical protein